MSQSAPRRAAPQGAERRQSNSPAQELKRKMATATVVVEKDGAIDKPCEPNGDREAKDKPSEGKSKAENKPGEPARDAAARNGDSAHKLNGKAPAAAAAAAADVPTQGAARPVGTDVPPNMKQQSKQQEGDKTKSDKDAKKEDKLSAKKEEKEKDAKKEDKKSADKTDKDNVKKDDKKAANKEDKGAAKKEEKNAATNGDEGTTQESGDRRKPDTNYSLSRVKISPYRRGRSGDVPGERGRGGDGLPGDSVVADESLGDCSTHANYAGNNSTMECDLSVSSASSSLRLVRGRASYRALPELSLSFTSRDSAGRRPTAPVVGRKRAAPSPAASDTTTSAPLTAPHAAAAAAASLLKRPRLAQMVGVNSDLPLCGVGGSELESLQPASVASPTGARDRRCAIV